MIGHAPWIYLLTLPVGLLCAGTTLISLLPFFVPVLRASLLILFICFFSLLIVTLKTTDKTINENCFRQIRRKAKIIFVVYGSGEILLNYYLISVFVKYI